MPSHRASDSPSNRSIAQLISWSRSGAVEGVCAWAVAGRARPTESASSAAPARRANPAGRAAADAVDGAGWPPRGDGRRLGSARLGSARLGSARLGSARLGSARLGSARLGSARLGSARLGSARLGSARLGSARLGSARLGSARLGSARLGSARLGSARLGSARLIICQANTLVECQVFCRAIHNFSLRSSRTGTPGGVLPLRFCTVRAWKEGTRRRVTVCRCRGAVKALEAVFFGAFLAIFKSARQAISEGKHFWVVSVRP